MAAAASLAGTGLQATGSIEQGNENASVANYNATIAQQNAGTVTAQGAEEARRSLINSNKVTGAAQANFGASGVAAGGSASDVLRSSAAQGELNALTIKNSAGIKATAYNNEAALDQYRAQNMAQAGQMKGASSILSYVGSLGSGGSSSSAADDSEAADAAEAAG